MRMKTKMNENNNKNSNQHIQKLKELQEKEKILIESTINKLTEMIQSLNK